MTSVGIGLLISASLALVLALLFAYENKRGVRFAEPARKRFDYAVLTVLHSMHTGTHFFITHVLRQVFHYSFHLILTFTLKLMKRSEHALRVVMRTNKTLARTAERESETRSKLEEIALHKIAVSLTEEEKKAVRHKTLKGH
jgi:hypothetical protein